ncbi:MAG: ABC transporter permease/substrate-binding protein [Alphaproteobacteria bacterium]|jgi:osmoprotectant transport system permease protein|nr:ABC transporter permease/substrate-binding protein [Alphaproteobacteria bacterium]
MGGTRASFAAALANLPDYLGQHVLLSLSALLLGLAISLPLGIIAARSRALRGPVLGFASMIQTIPSLALLALFYPVLLVLSVFAQSTFGAGFRALGFLPALLALTLYSMLPVLRNTVSAITGIDPAVIMAARAVGMTKRQTLFLVELPLAAPVIMAGIRTAAVWVIGTATLSTPVGQTSLGNYIFTGLQTENWIFVLFGCVAAALLTMVVDRLLALAEQSFSEHSFAKLIACLVGLALVVGASLAPMLASGRADVVVGVKNFSEQYILGSLIERHLAEAGFSTVRRDNLGSAVVFRALTANDVNVYIDYSGTIWTNEMKRTGNPGRKVMLREIRKWLKDNYGVADLGAVGFENAYAFAMRRDRAEALGIRTIADLAAHASQLKLGTDYEFPSRPEWRAVSKAYHFDFAVKRQYQPNFMYRAVETGDVDVISAFSSDGRIAQYDLVVLGDPKGALPPYDAIILVSPSQAHDEKLLKALEPLVGAIDLETMQKANLMVDRSTNKRTPRDAAIWLDRQISTGH